MKHAQRAPGRRGRRAVTTDGGSIGLRAFWLFCQSSCSWVGGWCTAGASCLSCHIPKIATISYTRNRSRSNTALYLGLAVEASQVVTARDS